MNNKFLSNIIAKQQERNTNITQNDSEANNKKPDNFFSKFNNALNNGEFEVPNTESELAIRRQSLASIFSDYANSMYDNIINIIRADYIDRDNMNHYAIYDVLLDVKNNMNFIFDLEFYFNYKLSSLSINDLVNQATATLFRILNNRCLKEFDTNKLNNSIMNFRIMLYGMIQNLSIKATSSYFAAGLSNEQLNQLSIGKKEIHEIEGE